MRGTGKGISQLQQYFNGVVNGINAKWFADKKIRAFMKCFFAVIMIIIPCNHYNFCCGVFALYELNEINPKAIGEVVIEENDGRYFQLHPPGGRFQVVDIIGFQIVFSQNIAQQHPYVGLIIYDQGIWHFQLVRG